MHDADQDAIRAIRAGNAEAYVDLVLRHGPRILRVAARITGNQQDAEEVAQEAFLQAFRKLADFQFRASFGTWLYRIAVRCAVDVLQKRLQEGRASLEQEPDGKVREVQLEDPAAGPERILLAQEVAGWQQQALHSLTPLERAAFVLRHVEERSTKEIASTLQVAPNAAKQAVFRAVQKMRLRLAPLKRCV